MPPLKPPGRQASSLLELIGIVDNAPDLSVGNCDGYVPFLIGGSDEAHGFMTTETVRAIVALAEGTDIEDRISYEERGGGGGGRGQEEAHPTPSRAFRVLPGLAGPPPAAATNAVLQRIVDLCIASDRFPGLDTHSEPFRVISACRGGEEAVRVERFAASIFGIATRGAHLTAYQRVPAAADDGGEGGTMDIWVARRSAHLVSYPDVWDSCVAGGVKAGDSPRTCMLEEALEEASLPRDWVAPRLKPVGAVTLANVHARTGRFHGEILYCYDLEIPVGEAFAAAPGDDGEVQRFAAFRPDELIGRMLGGEFKPNVCPVMIDFLIRHGVITPETEPEFAEICARLHRRLPVAVAAPPSAGADTRETVRARYGGWGGVS